MKIPKTLLWMLFLTSCSQDREVVYLDYAASYHVNDKALRKFTMISKLDGNSSGINSHANSLKNIENLSSKIIADKINAKLNQIHFTCTATMANNIAILGVARKHPGCHLITSKIEHKSVLEVFKYLESIGFKVTYLNVNRNGEIDLKQLRRCISNNTKLISIQMFNSEIGTLQDMKSIGEIAKQSGILFHTDAAQSFCKYKIDVDDMKIDLLTISGHKVGAPKGIAALYVRDISKLHQMLFGSGDILFPGTKPTALIASFASAVKNFSFDQKKVERKSNALVAELLKIEKIVINSITPSHVVSVSVSGVLLKDVIKRMKDYSFSAGCSCIGRGKSNVLEAIDPERRLPSCTIRVSFAPEVEPDRLVAFGRKLKLVVDGLRAKKAVGPGCEAAHDPEIRLPTQQISEEEGMSIPRDRAQRVHQRARGKIPPPGALVSETSPAYQRR